MGVVHKLQEDIRDFIIAQKKSFPKISCRKLSDIVYDKFSIIVSKSSISSVLKSANLNSPIGRHSLSVDELAAVNKQAPKKFKIPQQKKTQLFGNKKDDALALSDEKINLKVKKPESSAALVSENPGVRFSADGTRESLRNEMSNLSDKKLSNGVSSLKENQGVYVQNAGVVFLKAVEWNLTGVSILGKFFKDELNGRLDINFDKLADLAILSKTFDINETGKFKAGWPKELDSYFWFNDRDDVHLYPDALAAAENSSDCGIKLLLELEIFLQEVSCYKISYGDGQSFYINAKNRNVHCGIVQSGGSISLANALKTVDLEFIRNVHSAICCYSTMNPSIETFSESFFAVWKNQSESGAKEITLLDANNVELVKYSQISAKLKTGVLAVWSWEKVLPGVADFLKANQEVVSLKILNQTYFYKECLADKVFSYSGGKLKSFLHVIAISDSPTDDPFVVLLTNVGADQEAVKLVVYDFLLTWLGCEESKLKSSGNNEKNSMVSLTKTSLAQMQVGQAASLFESIKVFRQILRTVSQQYFFDLQRSDGGEDRIAEQIYGLSGHLFKEKRICRLIFVISEQDAVFLALKRAIQHFNDLGVFDSSGCRIILQTDSASG